MKVRIIDIATGKDIVNQWFERRDHVWPSVSVTVAQWFEVTPDEVGIVETERGDMIAVNDKIVADYVEVNSQMQEWIKNGGLK